MKACTVRTADFARELKWVARFIEKKTSIPILAHALLCKTDGFLHVTATDLELAGVTGVPVEGGDDFALTIPLAQLLKYLATKPGDALQLTPEIVMSGPTLAPGVEGPEPAPHVAKTRLTIACDDGSITVEGLATESYPELPKRPLKDVIELSGVQFGAPRVAVSISSEESRFTLNGALLDVQGKQARLISTDGHRLSVVELQSHSRKAATKTLIPRAALARIVDLGDAMVFSRDENHSFFLNGDRLVIARILTGNFPDWERVLPRPRYSVCAETKRTRKAIERVALLADERSRAVELTISDALEISTCQEGGSARARVPIAGPKFLSPYRSAMSSAYLLDFLKATDCLGFDYRFGDASSAVMLEVPGWQYVVMPMRAGETSDPCVEGETDPVPGSSTWDAPAAADPLEAYAQMPTCRTCGIPTINDGRICDACASPAVQDATAAVVEQYACPQCQQSYPGVAAEGELCPACASTWTPAKDAIAAVPDVASEPVSATATSTSSPAARPPRAKRSAKPKPPTLGERFASWAA